jgi:hypothetical protein
MKHRSRTLFVIVFALVATLGAGTVFAYVTNSGALASGGWKTAAGVSLQVPTTGTPKLAFTAQPGAGARIPVNGTFAVSVAIQDGFGTVVASDNTDKITLAIGHNPGHATLTCANPGGLTVRVSAGVASFTGVTSGTSHSTRSAALTCTSGATTTCTLSSQAHGGTSRFMSAQVTLVDQFQNPVANSSGGAVTLSLSQTGGDALSGTSVSIPAGASSSAPFTEKLTDGRAQATVTATATLGSALAIASLTS